MVFRYKHEAKSSIGQLRIQTQQIEIINNISMERKTNLVRSKVFYVLTILLVITISNSQAGLLKVWKGIDATVRRSYPDEDTRLILQNAELQGVVPTKQYLIMTYKLKDGSIKKLHIKMSPNGDIEIVSSSKAKKQQKQPKNRMSVAQIKRALNEKFTGAFLDKELKISSTELGQNSQYQYEYTVILNPIPFNPSIEYEIKCKSKNNELTVLSNGFRDFKCSQNMKQITSLEQTTPYYMAMEKNLLKFLQLKDAASTQLIPTQLLMKIQWNPPCLLLKFKDEQNNKQKINLLVYDNIIEELKIVREEIKEIEKVIINKSNHAQVLSLSEEQKRKREMKIQEELELLNQNNNQIIQFQIDEIIENNDKIKSDVRQHKSKENKIRVEEVKQNQNIEEKKSGNKEQQKQENKIHKEIKNVNNDNQKQSDIQQKKQFKPEVNELVEDIKHEIVHQIKPVVAQEVAQEVKQELTQQVKQEVAQEVKHEIVHQIKPVVAQEVAQEVKQELTPEVKQELTPEVKQELAQQVKQEVAQEVKHEIVHQIKPVVAQEVKQELAQQVKQEVAQQVKQEVAQQVKHEIVHQIKPVVAQEVAQEVKQEFAQEVKNEVYSYIKPQIKQKQLSHISLQGSQVFAQFIQPEVIHQVQHEVTPLINKTILTQSVSHSSIHPISDSSEFKIHHQQKSKSSQVLPSLVLPSYLSVGYSDSQPTSHTINHFSQSQLPSESITKQSPPSSNLRKQTEFFQEQQQDNYDQFCIKMKNGKCQYCYHRFYFSSKTKRCQPVQSQCQSYDRGSGACFKCYNGYNLRQGKCVTSDPLCTYIDQNNVCKRCLKGSTFDEKKGRCKLTRVYNY